MAEDFKVNDDFFSELGGDSGALMETQEAPGQTEQPETQEIPESQEKPEEPEVKTKEFDIKEHFPDFESIDEVKERLAKLKEMPADEDISKWKESAEKYNKHNEFIESLRNSGLNKDYLRLNALESQKSEKSEVFKKLLFGDLSDTDLIKLDLVSQYPELKDDKEMLEFQLEEKYPHIFGADADPESDEFQKAKKKMKFEANQVTKKLKSEFESIELPDTLNPDHKQEKMKKTIETWKGNFEEHSGELMTIDVNLDKEKFMDIEIPKNKQKDYKNAALMFIAQNGLNYSKESLHKVKDYVKAMYIASNLPDYNKAILEKRAQMSDEQWRKFVHNPAPVDKASKPKATKADDFSKFMDMLD
jgi:hypothetical protein